MSVRSNIRQQRFVEEYVADLVPNATEAARRAGYSTKTAKQIGSYLLTRPHIKAAVDAAQKAQIKRIRMSADDVLVGLSEIASADLADVFDEDGCLKPLKSVPAHVRRAISGIEVEELYEGRGEDREHIGRSRKVKLWDKPKALEILAKHHKMLTEKVEMTGAGGGPIAHALAEMSEEQLRALAGGSNSGVGKTPSD